MIPSHYLAIHEEGEVNLNNDEYSEYSWINIDELDKFKPKIQNIPEMVQQVLRLEKIASEKDFVII